MAGLTADGFVAKTLEDVEAGFVAQQRASIDANLDTSQFSCIGQLNGIMASEIAQLWELAEELHDAFDPDKAVGASQDALYSLTDTLREAATKSVVSATVTLAPGTSIAVGFAQASVAGNAAAKFTNAEPMVNATGVAAPFAVRFEAVTAGATIANAWTLTVIDTPLTGWTSITNALDAAPGTAIELDSIYRLRRIEELAAQGGGTVPGIRADLLQLATVRAATVLENFTSVTVGTLPPHSIEAVVRSVPFATDDAAIAESIWGNKAGGIETVGSTSVVVTDSEGIAHTVKFSRPTELAIYVALRLTTTTDYVGDPAAKTAIVAAAEDPAAVGYLDVGADVYAGRLVAAAMQLAGVLNAEAKVSLATIPVFSAGPTSVVVGQREIAALDSSRITISAIP